MTQLTIVNARSFKVTVPIQDSDFPIAAIPPKGAPGSAKGRVQLHIRTPDGIELTAEAAAKNLQKAQELAQASPGGYWVAQGKLG